jgi:hypothetical protein
VLFVFVRFFDCCVFGVVLVFDLRFSFDVGARFRGSGFLVCLVSRIVLLFSCSFPRVSSLLPLTFFSLSTSSFFPYDLFNIWR